jgi:hypothetical protein
LVALELGGEAVGMSRNSFPRYELVKGRIRTGACEGRQCPVTFSSCFPPPRNKCILTGGEYPPPPEILTCAFARF